jgi:SAM-dependent methyltransferase
MGPAKRRQMAESFGSDPERYDRSRPHYPQAMIDRIVAISPGRNFLDVGIGTGIAARQFEAAGCSVVGVDADDRMAGYARRQGLEVEKATFEAWDPAGRTFDAVVSGQTWHWVDPVAGAAKAAAVLPPGGRLAVFWNAGQPPADVAHSFADVYRGVLPDSQASRYWTMSAVDAYSGLCTRAADGVLETGAFTGPERWQFDGERTYSRDQWLDQLPTGGDASQFGPAELGSLLEGIGAAIDALGGRFTMHYTALVVSAVRAGTAWIRPVLYGDVSWLTGSVA